MKIIFKDSELNEGIINVSLDGGCGYGFRIIESNCPFNPEALYVSNGNVTYTSYTSLKQLCQYDGHFYTLYNDDTKRLSDDLYVKADTPGSCPYESDYIRVPYRLEELNHSRWALEKGGKSYIGDQLRLKLATENNDFFYADADVFIPNLSDITKHNK